MSKSSDNHSDGDQCSLIPAFDVCLPLHPVFAFATVSINLWIRLRCLALTATRNEHEPIVELLWVLPSNRYRRFKLFYHSCGLVHMIYNRDRQLQCL